MPNSARPNRLVAAATIALLASVNLTACWSWHVVADSPPRTIQIDPSGHYKIRTVGGTTAELDGATIRGDSLYGRLSHSTAATSDVAFDLRDVRSVERETLSVRRSLATLALTTALGIWGVHKANDALGGTSSLCLLLCN